jgi:hypothetical protein
MSHYTLGQVEQEYGSVIGFTLNLTSVRHKCIKNQSPNYISQEAVDNIVLGGPWLCYVFVSLEF